MTSDADLSLAADAPVSELEPRRVASLALDIISDTICPWCYVGKRRIDQAIEELAAEGLTVTTRWLPFELNPDMPVAGMDRRAYRSAKFGSWEHSQALDAQVAAEGAREGIAFRHDKMERTPNTRASHRLVWLAGEAAGTDAQSRVVEKLFSAYFCQGRDVGDTAVLIDIGVSSGLPEERVVGLLAGEAGTQEVLRHETWAASAGIRGVPSVIAGDLLLFSGAQLRPLVLQTLREVVATRTAAKSGNLKAQADARA